MEESKDLNELRKLAGMGTGTDLPPSFDRPTQPKPPGMGTGTDLPGPDGRYPSDGPPLFPGDEPVTIHIDDIKDKDDPRIYRGIDYNEIEREKYKIPPMFDKSRLEKLLDPNYERGSDRYKVPTQDDKLKDMIRRAREKLDNPKTGRFPPRMDYK